MLSEALRWANWHLVNAERRYDHPDECSPSTCVCGFAEFRAAATDSQSAVTEYRQRIIEGERERLEPTFRRLYAEIEDHAVLCEEAEGPGCSLRNVTNEYAALLSPSKEADASPETK